MVKEGVTWFAQVSPRAPRQLVIVLPTLAALFAPLPLVVALEHSSFGNYLHTMRFLDTALDDFQTSLAGAGLLDDTMLVVFGDHDAGFTHSQGLATTVGIRSDDASWELNHRIPFIVKWPAHLSPHLTGAVPIAAGQTDFAPTLLALLGIDPSRLPYIGRNLLGRPADVPIVRPYAIGSTARTCSAAETPSKPETSASARRRSPASMPRCADPHTRSPCAPETWPASS
jgi:membrane-anchored protein YejM (alkaline phosphatase superfamily)